MYVRGGDGEAREVVAGVQSGPDRRRAEIQLEQRRPRASTSSAPRGRCGVAAELLAERHRHRVLQVCAADLEHAAERRGLRVERVGQLPRRAHERRGRRQQRQPRRRREHVVGGLAHVDVVVRVDARVRAAWLAEELAGAVGQHLVGVHVVRRAGARLVDVHDELIAKPAGEDFSAAATMASATSRRQPSERLVRVGRAFFTRTVAVTSSAGRASR